MDALIIFSADNEHPLGFMLDKQHRHVWCAIKGDRYWHIYNWHQGIPVIDVVDADYFLADYYRQQGCEVIEIERGDEPCHGPWMCNNCVGHTMVVCGIRTHFIFTPHQLWKHITGNTMFNHIRKLFTTLRFVPGFGGGKTQFLPAPVTNTPTPSQTTVDADAKVASDEAARLAAKKKASAATESPSGTLLDDDDTGTSGALK